MVYDTNYPDDISFTNNINDFISNNTINGGKIVDNSININKISNLSSYDPNNFTEPYSYLNLVDIPGNFDVNPHNHDLSDINITGS
jgi:hypothetical protein